MPSIPAHFLRPSLPAHAMLAGDVELLVLQTAAQALPGLWDCPDGGGFDAALHGLEGIRGILAPTAILALARGIPPGLATPSQVERQARLSVHSDFLPAAVHLLHKVSWLAGWLVGWRPASYRCHAGWPCMTRPVLACTSPCFLSRCPGCHISAAPQRRAFLALRCLTLPVCPYACCAWCSWRV
jgi:hypothetical protein